MVQTYLRVPRVHQLEYLYTLINSYDRDGNYNGEHALKAVQQEIQEYEHNKARALRQKRPRFTEGGSTLIECLQLASHLGIIDKKKSLKPNATILLDPDIRRSFLLQKLWQIYPRFSQVVTTVGNARKLDLPLYNWDKFRSDGGDLHCLNLDRRNFETIRDFATQLGLINWYPTDKSSQVVYPTACVASKSEMICLIGTDIDRGSTTHFCLQTIALETGILISDDGIYKISQGTNHLPDGYLCIQTNNDQLYIKDHTVILPDFEQSLWQEYLALSGMIPMSPVLYPTLRNQVCAALTISDQIFDHLLFHLIMHPERLRIHPSDGTLNYTVHLAHIGKLLPPQTSEGNFIVFLKIERSKIT